LLRRCRGLWACRLLWCFISDVPGSCFPLRCYRRCRCRTGRLPPGVCRFGCILPLGFFCVGIQSAVSVRWDTAFRLDAVLMGVDLLLLLGQSGSLRLGWLRGTFGESAWSWTRPRVLVSASRRSTGEVPTELHYCLDPCCDDGQCPPSLTQTHIRTTVSLNTTSEKEFSSIYCIRTVCIP
jgi:hypothetical protein